MVSSSGLSAFEMIPADLSDEEVRFIMKFALYRNWGKDD